MNSPMIRRVLQCPEAVEIKTLLYKRFAGHAVRVIAGLGQDTRLLLPDPSATRR